MKKLLLLTLLLLNISIFSQSSQDQQDKQWRQEMTIRNGFPATPAYPTTQGVFDTSRVDEVKKSKPIILPPRQNRVLTQDEIEELEKEEARVNALRAPRAEDLLKYSEFLKEKNTGIFRLFPDLGCGGKLLVDANDECVNAVSLSWSYSLIHKNYGNSHIYDLRLKDEDLVADGFLAQHIFVPLGNIDLSSVTLNSNGMKFLTDFKPENKSKLAKEQFAQIAKKINADGYIYGKQIRLSENQTFGMRLISYKLADRHKIDWKEKGELKSKEELDFYWYQYSKGADKVIAFQIIRKETDGSITILWKELSNEKAPIIVFDKNEKLTDLKLDKASSK